MADQTPEQAAALGEYANAHTDNARAVARKRLDALGIEAPDVAAKREAAEARKAEGDKQGRHMQPRGRTAAGGKSHTEA